MFNFKNIRFTFVPHQLRFNFVAKTSRGTLSHHQIYVLKAYDARTKKTAYGEVSPLFGLSSDFDLDFHQIIPEIFDDLKRQPLPKNEADVWSVLDAIDLKNSPSLRFGFETLLLDMVHGSRQQIFDGAFYKGVPIPINGLVWMSSIDDMMAQVNDKIAQGFRCIKLKIGAKNIQEELGILQKIRAQYSKDDIILRVDANGAFAENQATSVLKALKALDVHSIEQPIQHGQPTAMKRLIDACILPIALDEELILASSLDAQINSLNTLKPHFIILKPQLIGGFERCRTLIQHAQKLGVGWWMTSALESNIGLNAIAQFQSLYQSDLPQGLGTGSLYHNNFDSPLVVNNGQLHFDKKKLWRFNI